MRMNITYEQMEQLLAPTYKVGIYCRLSKDDDIREGESQSIGHQREILREFCRKKGWKVEKEYVDDGYSGLNMERPSLKQLLDDVAEKKINVVVTKDYSRLGRNHLETERLREDFFPRNNCRYIAINDNIDTMYEDEYAPFKAIINEQYSRDISKKIHSAYANQAEKGRYTGVVPPFGYLKDPDSPGHLIIDEETALYVKQMFEWARDGHGVAYIKRRLEANKVPCPTWWNRERKLRNHYTKWEIQDPENGKYVWDESVLKDMLINPVYYGAVSAQKFNYKFKIGILGEKKPEEWIVVEGMHDPIISQDVFDIVQEKIKARKGVMGNGTTSLFCGLVKCGECGKSLVKGRTNSKSRTEILVCKTYNRHGKNHCSQHRIFQDTLYNIVCDEIRELAKQTVDAEEVADSLAEAYETERKEQTELLKRNIAKAKSRMTLLEQMTSKLYEDLIAERISETLFNSLIEKTRNENAELQKQVEDFEEQLAMDSEDNTDARKWIDLIKDYADIKELDSETLNRLIKKIIVHEDRTEDGKKDISIEIHYNFRPLDETKSHYLSDYTEKNSDIGA